MSRIGVAYLASNQIQTSIANEEIIPLAPSNWTMPYKLYKFSLMNNSDCTLIVNNETEIFLQANQGFATGETDARIASVKIKESGIEFNWIGAY